jgi:nitrogen fixation/metabolism regulation signal transduction histidine kinase
MAEVDVVVLAIDDDGKIRLANDAASRVLATSSRDLIGKRAADLGLADLLEGAVPRIATVVAPSASALGSRAAAWELRRGSFRLSGEQQTLVVLSDVSRALRDNERDAWRRLIRVMGHEINNSLSPIQSIAGSLRSLLGKRPPEWESDVGDGLAVIERRAEALGRFMASYAALAKLPPPRRAPIDLRSLVRKTAALEMRVPVDVSAGPDVTVNGDADQLEQALINLLKNAAEASLATERTPSPSIRVSWAIEDDATTIIVEDDGPGVSETANLFVPFFTTKPNGSGIGLALSRQIVEAHEGDLSVATRPGGIGAIARLRLPR